MGDVKVDASIETYPGTLNTSHINRVLDIAASELSTIGDRFFEYNFLDEEGMGGEGEIEKEKVEKLEYSVVSSRYEGAMKARNKEKKFPYPTGGAFLPLDIGHISDEQQAFTREGVFTSGDIGPFTASLSSSMEDANFNAAISAFITLLASRQYSARAANRYPMTFFVGPGSGGVPSEARSRKERNESELLSRYDRIAFTSNAEVPFRGGSQINEKVRWVAIASIPPTSAIEGRAPSIIAWANFVPLEKPDDPTYSESVEKLRKLIGKSVVERWQTFIHDAVVESDGIFTPGTRHLVPSEILNRKQLEEGSSDFIRSTGSTQTYSVLWPLTQLSMTRDDSLFFNDDRLYTRHIAAETSEAMDTLWYKSLDKLTNPDAVPYVKPQTSAWLRWTTSLLSMGILPYIRHTQSPYAKASMPDVVYEPVRARPHLTRDTMIPLARVVMKKLQHGK